LYFQGSVENLHRYFVSADTEPTVGATAERTHQLAGNDGLPLEVSGAWSLLAVLLPQAFAETNVQTEGTFCISGRDDGGIIIHTVFHNNHLLVVR
jgi:hypothetical protein